LNSFSVRQTKPASALYGCNAELQNVEAGDYYCPIKSSLAHTVWWCYYHCHV